MLLNGFWPLTMVNLNVVLHGWSHSKLQPNWFFMIMHEKQKRSNCEFTSQICQADGKRNDHRDQGKDLFCLRNDIFLEDMNLPSGYWESRFEAGGWCILPTWEASWSLNLKSPQNLTTSRKLPRLHVRYTWALSWFLRSRSNKRERCASGRSNSSSQCTSWVHQKASDEMGQILLTGHDLHQCWLAPNEWCIKL